MTYAAEEQATTRESGAVEVMDAVFRKTILGYNESEHHHVLSRPQLRRLLDLIDGEQGLDARGFSTVYGLEEAPEASG